mgnify:CR=1 FL=1
MIIYIICHTWKWFMIYFVCICAKDIGRMEKFDWIIDQSTWIHWMMKWKAFHQKLVYTNQFNRRYDIKDLSKAYTGYEHGVIITYLPWINLDFVNSHSPTGLYTVIFVAKVILVVKRSQAVRLLDLSGNKCWITELVKIGKRVISYYYRYWTFWITSKW